MLSPLGLIFLLLLLAQTAPLRADSIVNSKHNLSAQSASTIKASTESEICIFCHVPHGGVSDAPLWNRYSSGATYVPYSSSTTKAVIGQPTGDSKLCLSCHDGTVALGLVRSRVRPIQFQSGVSAMPAGAGHLGTDLADDHPISFTYDSALAGARGQLRDPSVLLAGPAHLDHNDQLQCTTCHDPHDNQYGKFLVTDNTASALCRLCHVPNYWFNSVHNTSTKSWNGIPPDPWPHTGATTVRDNACENCHRPHAAGTKPRLLIFANEADNCYACHNGNVATHNLQSEFNKFSVHPIAATAGLHDPAEDPVNPPRHTTCADCHNPHAAQDQDAAAPNASGALAGVTGVNASGTIVRPLTYEYELCFRCHADSLARPPARVTRQFVQTNTRLEFSPANASFHPIETIGKNPNSPSLMSPWTASSMMKCTDCHNNNAGPGAGGTGPNGPHGSAYVPLLERRLELTDSQAETSAIYALCYKCHSRTSILNDESFSEHRKHIVEERVACTSCHDPHGVQNTPHLINFNTTYVTPSQHGPIAYVSTGFRSGWCTLKCHGEDHNRETYPHD